jgi:hypothetical protein
MHYFTQKGEISILDKCSSIFGELTIGYRDIYRVFLTSDRLRNGKGSAKNVLRRLLHL